MDKHLLKALELLEALVSDSLQSDRSAAEKCLPKIQALESLILNGSDNENKPESLPGSHSPMLDLCLPDIIEAYDNPDESPVYEWCRRVSSYECIDNGDHGVWDFIINLACLDEFEECPCENFVGLLRRAESAGYHYVLVNQGC